MACAPCIPLHSDKTAACDHATTVHTLGFGQMPFFVYGFQDETISSRDLNLTSCYSLHERCNWLL